MAWWGWSIGLAAAASFTTNPFTLLLLVGSVGFVVALRRGDQPWSRSFRLYLMLAAFVVVMRVVFRILLGGGYPGQVLVDLPEIGLPSWAAGIHLLGPVTRESLLAGLYDGMRLAAIIVCIGAANALANPKRLLRSLPPALYEVGTALVVAVTVFPQFAESARRVRAAQELRAGQTGWVGRLRRQLVPVLEDALDHALAMAAGMDARGYGRTGEVSPARRRITGALFITGLLGICVGVYISLDGSLPTGLATPLWAGGLVLAVAGIAIAGQGVERTRYRPQAWRWQEFGVLAAGIAAAAVARWSSSHELLIAYPATDAVPTISLAVLAMLAAALIAGPIAPAAQEQP